jgi:hypothetical protein
MIQEFSKYRPLESVIAMTWMILDATFVVAFPTLVSAMSGYKTSNEAFLRDDEGNYMAFSRLYQVDYIIQDSSRLNKLNITPQEIRGFNDNKPFGFNYSSPFGFNYSRPFGFNDNKLFGYNSSEAKLPIQFTEPYILRRPQSNVSVHVHLNITNENQTVPIVRIHQ